MTGAVSSALDIWTETHGKPPTYKDVVDEIAPQVIRQKSAQGFFHFDYLKTPDWMNTKTPFYKQDIPPEWSKDYKTEIVSQGGIEPTDEQVYRAYIRSQMLDLFPVKKQNKEAPRGR